MVVREEENAGLSLTNTQITPDGDFKLTSVFFMMFNFDSMVLKYLVAQTFFLTSQ